METSESHSNESESPNDDILHDVVVVGGGAAGIGVAVALQDAGIEKMLVLEQRTVGASFEAWPAETRFITPSFPTNSVGMLDLNAVVIGSSPALSLGVEHPSGAAFADHLRAIAAYFELPIRENTHVEQVQAVDGIYVIRTANGLLRARHVVWAAGEFHYPQLKGFAGSQHCRHTATVPSYEELEGDKFVVIGGYESGVDAAYHLSKRGKEVILIDKESPWESKSHDPSISLSTFTRERMREPHFVEKVKLIPNTPIVSVAHGEGGYTATGVGEIQFTSDVPPLFAGGFEGSLKLVSELFDSREDGFPHLTDDDESTISPGLFLCGPAVRHGNHIFCFIFKYRQRFAVVAKAVATSLGLEAEGLETYRQWGMYLDDLSCCGQDCVC